MYAPARAFLLGQTLLSGQHPGPVGMKGADDATPPTTEFGALLQLTDGGVPCRLEGINFNDEAPGLASEHVAKAYTRATLRSPINHVKAVNPGLVVFLLHGFYAELGFPVKTYSPGECLYINVKVLYPKKGGAPFRITTSPADTHGRLRAALHDIQQRLVRTITNVATGGLPQALADEPADRPILRAIVEGRLGETTAHTVVKQGRTLDISTWTAYQYRIVYGCLAESVVLVTRLREVCRTFDTSRVD